MKLTPEQVKALRSRAGKTQGEAAKDVYVALRRWQGWEAPVDAASHREMPVALVELFCLKNSIPFPPKL
jgi:hypothetical protein